MSATEEMIKLKCECGEFFERAIKYQTYNEQNPNVVFRWKLKYCDECLKKKADNALKRLPEVINAITKEAK